MQGPVKVRRLPVIVEAWRYDGTNAAAIADWAGDAAREDWDGSLIIATPGGEHRADPGDWVVRGLRGEHYLVEAEGWDGLYEAAP